MSTISLDFAMWLQKYFDVLAEETNAGYFTKTTQENTEEANPQEDIQCGLPERGSGQPITTDVQPADEESISIDQVLAPARYDDPGDLLVCEGNASNLPEPSRKPSKDGQKSKRL